ncbi:hypothetical protein FHG87_007351 [Trinorchestia longiramus]|nr:hypothetical protein FHG87_007351 [Trinorchestia longiramus]
MEKINRKVTKMIPVLRNISYERRLQQLGLIPLEQRRLRGQLIETYMNIIERIKLSSRTNALENTIET